MNKRRKKPNNRAKIYYSYDPEPRLYWWVKVKNATTSVKLKGSLAHALLGYPGMTVACHLANCSTDKINKSAFPHPCHLASFNPTTAFIVTKFKDGAAVEAVRYLHSYRYLVELNDKKINNDFIKEHPDLAERSFILRPYKKQPRRGGTHTGTHEARPKIAHLINHRGALGRAQLAGLISRPVAEAIKQ